MTGDAVAQSMFWIFLGLVVYTYLLYPLLLLLAYVIAQAWRDLRYLGSRQDRRVPIPTRPQLPTVTMLIPAFNEEQSLPAKIDNLRRLDYPRESLRVIFVSDGSTDGTNRILGQIDDPGIQVLLLSERGGKANALNAAAGKADTEILVFSDASTLFEPDAVKQLVRHFSSPLVGAVCGALRFQGSAESQQTEGVYWRYESLLRLMEARLGATLTASGAIYALRRECYRPLPATTMIEDLMVPMQARSLGYRVLYDPEAVGVEVAASSVAGEFTRRVRLAVGSFRALPELARIRMGAVTSWAFFSHKLLRWFLPFLMIGLLGVSLILWDRPFYRGVLIGQGLFYLWGGLGFLFQNQMQRIRYALVGYFLLAMHLAFLVGFFRSVFGREKPTWQRVS